MNLQRQIFPSPNPPWGQGSLTVALWTNCQRYLHSVSCTLCGRYMGTGKKEEVHERAVWQLLVRSVTQLFDPINFGDAQSMEWGMDRNEFWVISNTFVIGLNEGHNQGHVKVKVTKKNACALNRQNFAAFLYTSGSPKDIREGNSGCLHGLHSQRHQKPDVISLTYITNMGDVTATNNIFLYITGIVLWLIILIHSC